MNRVNTIRWDRLLGGKNELRVVRDQQIYKNHSARRVPPSGQSDLRKGRHEFRRFEESETPGLPSVAQEQRRGRSSGKRTRAGLLTAALTRTDRGAGEREWKPRRLLGSATVLGAAQGTERMGGLEARGCSRR
ncbi:hypothetical protein NDU88_007505 [Pleurodeles waltl]|uniref:Uncharacterized protein n=1 Tax=Pleurodeles waltl TaxID=8319 RepID=A0AAV7NBN4_PLEWA|nr:hypothetical protein NDU88_007505 [Pleurodeles waltl]